MRKSWISLKDVDIFVANRADPVLRRLNFTVAAGEWIGVVGRNGCGKSVFGKLLAGLEGQYNGDVELDGQGRFSQVRWVMQNPDAQLIGETVWDDIIFGLENIGLEPSEILTEARRSLELIGLMELADRPVQRLSGGQKQLLAIAGAVAMRPKVLIADEVTSMLDPLSRERVLDVLAKLHRQGTAVVMITQMLEELSHVERVIALEGGTMAYDGQVRPFFYRGMEGSPGVCESLGLIPPYVVQVVKGLHKRGFAISGYPLSLEELEKGVSQKWVSGLNL